MEERLRFVARLLDGEAMTGRLPGFRRIPEDWLQDIRSLQGARAFGPGRSVMPSGALRQPAAAIIDFILRKYGEGRLQPAPSDANYDDYVHWMHYAEGSGMPALIVRINVARVGDAAAPALPPLDSEIALQLGYLNSALEGRPYILGDGLSAADIQLSFIGELAAARFGISAYPNVEAWVKRFQAREAYKAALAKGGIYSFAA